MKSYDGTILRGETEELGEKAGLELFCPSHIPHGLNKVRTWAFSFRGQRLTAKAMARPSPNSFIILDT